MPASLHLLGYGCVPGSLFAPPGRRSALFLAAEEAAEVWGAVFHAYAVTPRFAHLVLGFPDEEQRAAELAAALRRGFGELARRRPGLEELQVRDAPLDDAPALLGAVRYAHMAPVRCGLVPRPEAEPWSSARAYRGCEPLLRPLLIAPVLGLLPGPEASSAFLDPAVSQERFESLLRKEPPAVGRSSGAPARSPRKVRDAQGRADPGIALRPGEGRRRARSAS